MQGSWRAVSACALACRRGSGMPRPSARRLLASAALLTPAAAVLLTRVSIVPAGRPRGGQKRGPVSSRDVC